MNIEFLEERAKEAREKCERLDVERHRLSLIVQESRDRLGAVQSAGDVDGIHSAAERLDSDEKRLKPIGDALERATATLRAIDKQISDVQTADAWRVYFENVVGITKRATAQQEEFEREFRSLCRYINIALERLSETRDEQNQTRAEFEDILLKAFPKLGMVVPQPGTPGYDGAVSSNVQNVVSFVGQQLLAHGATADGIAAAKHRFEASSTRLPAMAKESDVQQQLPNVAYSAVVAELLDERRAAIAARLAREALARASHDQHELLASQQAWLLNAEQRGAEQRATEEAARTEQRVREGSLALVNGWRVEQSPPEPTGEGIGVGMDALSKPERPW